ncbi:MAG: hypothetical protein HZR80_06265 [Candidatus Heimdallarchaeota archaeon]
MFRLNKIIDVTYKRTCFCGRPLIRNFCEKHGTDVKISTSLIHAQFDFIEESKTKDDNQIINVNLTKNQFLNLFKKKKYGNIEKISENYSIKISSFGADEPIQGILTDFFDMLECDSFFGMNRIKEVQMKNSGVFFNFLFSYEQIEDNLIHINFELVVLRKLIDYIQWRLTHFHAKKENIVKSLKNTRSKVYNEDGCSYKIKEVIWSTHNQLPDKTVVEELENQNNEIAFKVGVLYQNHEDFFLSTKAENQLVSALTNYSQNFLKSLKQYLTQKSFLAEINVLKFEDRLKLFEEFIGKEVVNSSAFVEKINNQIFESYSTNSERISSFLKQGSEK